MVAATTTRKNALGNFYPDLVNLRVMRAFTKKNGIKLEADETDAEQYALALTLHFREEEKDPDKFAQCETCHGESPDTCEACPFCGNTAPPVDEDAGDPTPQSAPVVKTAKTEETSTSEETTMAKTKSGKGDKKKTTSEKSEKKLAAGEKPSTALATTGSAAMSVKLLDEAVDRVIALKVAGAESFWKLGREILAINQDGLWKQRLDEKGKQRYASFEAFCTHELNISGTYAFQIMNVAREFTMEQIATMGRAKSILVWKAAPEDRKEIAEKAAAGATKREIAKEVQKSREKHKINERSERAKSGAKGAKKKAANKAAKEEKAAPEKITIAKIEGLNTVKLYAKPATLKNLNLDDCKRAEANKAVQEAIERIKPFGRFELANGVAMYLSVFVDKTGALAVKVNTQRESPVDG